MVWFRKISKFENVLRLLFCSLLFLILQFPAHGKPPGWFLKLKQIQLFETRRSEVEKLFNYPKITYVFAGETGISVEYELEAGQLTVDYSYGDCFKGNNYDYNVPKDKVIEISMKLNKPVDILKFDINLDKFQKEEISDVKGAFIYTSEDSGEEITGGAKQLQNITFSPTKEQEKLACKNFK